MITGVCNYFEFLPAGFLAAYVNIGSYCAVKEWCLKKKDPAGLLMTDCDLLQPVSSYFSFSYSNLSWNIEDLCWFMND